MVKKEKERERQLSRRTFVKGSALTALATAATAGGLSTLYGCSTPAPGGGEATAPEEKVVWSGCNINGCDCYCPLQYHLQDGEVLFVEPDTTIVPEHEDMQLRACLRGRSVRRMLNHPDRLKYPMKRVGKRGEGQFEQITWDEAISLFSENLKRVINTYGNEAVYSVESAGNFYSDGQQAERLLNCLGGQLGSYGTDSAGQISEVMVYLYGPLDSWGGSSLMQAANADLLVMFGHNPCGNRMGGYADTYALHKVREAGTRIINIDYRLNESAAGHSDEWLAIRPNTDAALASAIAYVLIAESLVDEDFLHTYCQGYDEQTMPDGVSANSSYKDYILGTGYDMIAKTPEWASPITLIPAEKIYELAREIGNAETVYVCQGWGPQRSANGENVSRAIAMVAILTGNIGLSGTNMGTRPNMYSLLSPVQIAPVENPVKTTISCVSRIDVIDHGEQMTALHDGVRGKDKLETGVKFAISNHCNCLANQQPGVNRALEVLSDESKLEYHVVIELFQSSTANYADLLLPDAMAAEAVRCRTTGATECEGVVFGQQVVAPKFDRRHSYDILADVADQLGVYDIYTEGKTWEDWQKNQYAIMQGNRTDMPSYEEGTAMGVWKNAVTTPPALQSFREDPSTNPLSTPSGKIEIWSSQLAEMASTWEFDFEEDILSPIPIYNPGYGSYLTCSEKYPLTLAGWHPKQRVHSTWDQIDLLKQAVRQQVWINPVDAQSRGIQNGDITKVHNTYGAIEIEARVTPRIIPGTLGIPEGKNSIFNSEGIDKNGNVNVLTKSYPLSPLAKHNPSNTNIAQIEKL
jgi:DmsA/YnfE family anaerobic dimethyl sulfoxide reductase A subunit